MHIRTWQVFAWVGLLSLVPASAMAAELEVRIKPGNARLKENVTNHVGDLGNRDEEQLLRYSSIAHRQAEQALQALGYYQGRIQTEVRGGSTPRLIIRIDAGSPVRLRNVSVRIEGDATQLSDFKGIGDSLKPGAILDHGVYEETKQQILNLASRYGFFAGRFTRQRLVVDPAAGKADIELLYDSGPRYRLGEVAFNGDDPFDKDLLQRMVPFKRDTPYDSSLIVDLNQALQSSGYFDGVRVDANPAMAKDQRIPVAVQLTTKEPRTLGVGLGFSTDIGPRLSFDWERHWVNPEGHSYGAQMELSDPRQNIGFWYEIPLDPPLTNKLRYAGGYQYQEIAGTDSKSSLLTLGPEWHSQYENGWQRVLSLKWLNEDYHRGDDSGSSTFLMPGVAFNYMRSDNRINPSQGYRLEFKLSAAKDGVLSNADLLRSEMLFKGLTTLWKRHRFLGRIQLGGNLTDEYKSIPPSLRFFAGGDQSVRGYDYQDLSPTNSDNDRIGGRFMVAASAEYQYSLTDKWRIASFIDQGNAFNSLDAPALKTSVGMGVRWVSPVGPIRVDLAQPLDDGGGIHFHFSMGPEL
ncbi:translocation and assembly module TamA [Azomonas macrocytogenes]|uniref:Translocation and assembly module subunit TamA n=2 Tax=Azomonas macrocytogenes TaxID=69962 RepID=A0A839TB71_AZOMA|nr:autotransporter assembly complex family protein [Azomonas macrocytogenes]MBB3104863.1 translocation and assembly module TamA [Azomonas macrocytogenes]